MEGVVHNLVLLDHIHPLDLDNFPHDTGFEKEEVYMEVLHIQHCIYVPLKLVKALVSHFCVLEICYC